MTITELRIAYILSCLFVLIPLIAGIDKFFHVITDWDQYVSPVVIDLTHIPAHTIMLLAGPVEILVGLTVAFNARIGSLALIAMLLGIVADLLTMPKQLHLVSLDLSLAICACCLYMLSDKAKDLERKPDRAPNSQTMVADTSSI